MELFDIPHQISRKYIRIFFYSISMSLAESTYLVCNAEHIKITN